MVLGRFSPTKAELWLCIAPPGGSIRQSPLFAPPMLSKGPRFAKRISPSFGSSEAPGRLGEGVQVGPSASCVPTGHDLGQVISPPWTSCRPHPLPQEKERAWWALRPSPVLTSFNSEFPAHCLGTKVPILPEVPRAPRPHPWLFRVPAGSNHHPHCPFLAQPRDLVKMQIPSQQA